MIHKILVLRFQKSLPRVFLDPEHGIDQNGRGIPSVTYVLNHLLKLLVGNHQSLPCSLSIKYYSFSQSASYELTILLVGNHPSLPCSLSIHTMPRGPWVTWTSPDVNYYFLSIFLSLRLSFLIVG